MAAMFAKKNYPLQAAIPFSTPIGEEHLFYATGKCWSEWVNLLMDNAPVNIQRHS